VDFWAQHKDFVLKVLAGVGVFLVALIARSITYGDELEIAERSNATMVTKIKRTKVAPIPKIRTLEENAGTLNENAEQIRDQIGWNAGRGDREKDLIRRILGYLRRWKDRPASELNEAADLFRRAIQNNLNGGFGQLRLAVREALLEEAGERNIRIEGGVGYESIVELEQPELLKYLMQLELAARLARYLIDSGVAAIEEIRIETRDLEPIPGANRAFLREPRIPACRSRRRRRKSEPRKTALRGGACHPRPLVLRDGRAAQVQGGGRAGRGEDQHPPGALPRLLEPAPARGRGR
jgi:hypothetical protein